MRAARAVTLQRIEARLNDAIAVGEIPATVDVRGLSQFAQAVQYGMAMFCCSIRPRNMMSENVVNQGLRRLGYTSDQMTAHGVRAVAATLLNEMG